MAETFCIRELPNGLTLLGQPMETVSSAAMTMLVPAGASHDPDPAAGASSVLAEWCFRGAGGRDTRALHEALDSLGCQHQEHVQSEHAQFATAQLGRNLPAVLALYADVLRRPALADETFEPCRALILQDLESLEDHPDDKCRTVLRENFYPYPLGRCTHGRAESLRAMSADDVRRQWRARFSPTGAILAAAGRFDWEELVSLAERYFGDWVPANPPGPDVGSARGGTTHLSKPSAQVHIALAHRTATFSSPWYYPARMAEMVLSGGMSSRLFTEVREKRGLVYHVSSHYHTLKDCAGMFTYAGTTPERAQETLEVTVAELRRLGEGVGEDEMDRARTQLKAALVMQGESTSARAAALASDWYYLRRLRGLEEISRAIGKVTVPQVLDCWRAHPARFFTVMTIGPAEVDVRKIES